jgi:cell wall-associated NlpC family hydrolase
MRCCNLAPLWLGAMGLGLLVQGCSSTGSKNEITGDTTRQHVVMAALSQIGTRYQYGAGYPGNALDCSALTQHAYRAAGLVIPRISTDQRKAATPVPPTKVKPGDLVFFVIRPGLHHVGLMVDDKRFVHASTSERQVRVSSLESDYWQRRLVGAGSYLN